MKKRLLVGLSLLAMTSLVFTGCGSGSQGSKISIVGSTTVAEPMENLVSAYKESGSTDNIEVQGTGSSAGIKAVIDQTADIGMVSRELSEAEKKESLTETEIAYDGIAMVVNPANGVTDLTKEQVKAIYEGHITNWSEVGGKNEEIIVVTREAGSGTRGAFEEIVGLLDDSKASTIIDTALVGEGTGTIMATVASKEAAIGFVSLGYINDTVKALGVDGVKPGVETVKNGSYAISRPLLLVTKPELKEEAKKVIDFILSDKGQEIIGEKYITVNN